MSKRKKEYAADVLKREIEERKMKLKPCPFCGGETKIDNRGECGYGIVCISCGAKSPDFQTETNAIKSWNDYANDLLKTEQIKPEISLDGIHPDLINGLLEAKRNYPKLKPCPFCNGEAEVDCRLGLCSVVCKDCGARVSSFGDVNPAIKAWNKRVDVAKTENATCKKNLQVSRSDFETLEKAYHNALDAYHDVAEKLEELKARSRK